MSKTRRFGLMLLAVLLLVPALTGCTKSSGTLELEAKNTIEEETITDVLTLSEEGIGQMLLQYDSEFLANYLESGQSYGSIPFSNSLLTRWRDFESKHGKVTGVRADGAEGEEGTYVSHLVLTGEDGQEMRLNIHFDEAANPHSTTLEPYADDSGKTFGQKMAEAGMNTLIGLLVVFTVLILLTLVISAMKSVNAIGQKPAKKTAEAATAETTVKAAAPAPAAAPAQADDGALIAVIAAAIAEAEGTTTDAFVVRSIKRLKNNRW